MSVNIYDTANQLEKEIRETEQFVKNLGEKHSQQ